MNWQTAGHILDFIDLHNGAVTAVATVFIAIFTVVLAVVTGRQARLTRVAAEATRKAATIAERALTELERPWLFLQGARITWRDSHTPPAPRLPNDWFISLKWKNVGRMPALVEDCIFKFADKASLPTSPDYSDAGHLRCPGTVAPNEEVDTTVVGPAPGRPNELVFFGRITYKELNGKLHHTGFALEVAPHMPTFDRHANDAYDYYD